MQSGLNCPVDDRDGAAAGSLLLTYCPLPVTN